MVWLTTDVLLWGLCVLTSLWLFQALRQPQWRRALAELLCQPLAVSALMVLGVYVFIGLIDSLHFNAQGQIVSQLDRWLSPAGEIHEVTYSEPFAKNLFTKTLQINSEGHPIFDYQPLQHVAGTSRWLENLFELTVESIAFAVFVITVLTVSSMLIVRISQQIQFKIVAKQLFLGKTQFAWRSALLMLFILLSVLFFLRGCLGHYHILGTDQIGHDVFYAATKSIRTGLIIGILTTLVMLPFALFFGTMAGYFGGFIDDLIQYLYTTLSSIPAVLLIAASVLSIQVYISNHQELFSTMESRADARLLALCIILGITSWTNLCRVLRAETMKLRELDYIQAAKALGVGWFTIIRRHIVPNTMHLVLIAVALDFSMLVLAEAVLTYVGIGVDPTTYSWGNMINVARLELAREPVVWWPLVSAFGMMFLFVLSANIVADRLRVALDPRQR